MKRTVFCVLMIILIMAPVVNAAIIDTSAEFIVENPQSVENLRKVSFSIIALSTTNSDTERDYTPQIEDMIMILIENQNPDGGWGLYPGEPSNVLDTAYAIIALRRAVAYLNPPFNTKALIVLRRGVKYIVSANNGASWGYIPKSSSSCYPTLVAVWALGENGYSFQRNIIKRAFSYINNTKNCELSQNERIALELIARYYTKAPVNNKTIEVAKSILQENLPTKERAMLTYALALYEPFEFNTVKALSILINQSKNTLNNLTYWANTPNLFGNTETIMTTTYSIMAISILYNKPVPPQTLEGTTLELCGLLASMQKQEGGWGTTPNDDPKPIVTYYALKALSTCYGKDSEIIQNGILFMREASKVEETNVVRKKQLSSSYYYAIKTLIEFNELTDSEKKEIIDTILNGRLNNGLWGSTILGPQPLDTAMAIDLLLDLGFEPTDEIIQNATNWLLDISNTGWGTYIQTRYFGYMLRPNAFTTATVLRVLKRVTDKEEVKTNLEWLETQKINGGWAYFKYHENVLGKKTPQIPDIFITAEVTRVLWKYGVDYRKDSANLILQKFSEVKRSNLYLASAILILNEVQPVILLENVVDSMNSENFKIFVDSDKFNVSLIVSSLNRIFKSEFKETLALHQMGNYIIVTRLESVDIKKYNPQAIITLSEEGILMGNVTAPKKNTVILVPGMTQNGVILFVIYTPGSEDIVIDIFTTGFIEYIHGHAMILTKKGSRIDVITVR